MRLANESLLTFPFLLSHVLTCALAAQSVEPWQDEQRVGGFVYHADFELSSHQELLDEIVELEHDITRVLELQARGQPIDVYLFARKKSFRRYLEHYFPAAPDRRAMFIKTRYPGNVFAFAHAELATDLRHECTHAILHKHLPYVPLWLDEGLAEYFEVKASDRSRPCAQLGIVKRAVFWRRPTSLVRLERIRRLSDMGQREYQDAWAWVHFMMHGPPAAKSNLLTYLKDVRHDVNPEPLSQRLIRNVPSIDDRFAQHFR